MPALRNGIRRQTSGTGGQVRAKSGCYTCRLRRKKCAEDRDDQGRCSVCLRLGVQCLGFGAKRPDFVKAREDEIKQKIKAHCIGSKHKNRTATDSPLVLVPELIGDTCLDDSPGSSASIHNRLLPEYEYATSSTTAPHGATITTPGLSMFDPNLSAIEGFGDLESFSLSFPTLDMSSAPDVRSNLSSYFLELNIGLDEFSAIESPYSVPSMLMPADCLVTHYLNVVSGKQWLLVNQAKLLRILGTCLHGEGLAYTAVCLLANIDMERHRRRAEPEPACLAMPKIRSRYDGVKHMLQWVQVTADVAWAALFIISSILFDGGVGEWEMWVATACTYARHVMYSIYPTPLQAFMACTDDERFCLKAAIWFDVLAAVTTCSPPLLLDVIRDLFDPNASHVGDSMLEELCMLEAMGCESRVVWALAEILALSAWKEAAQQRGDLSIPELVQRSLVIDECLSRVPLPCLSDDPTALKRHYTAEMFRTSAIVFLRSVVSGDFPRVREVKEAVGGVFGILKELRGRDQDAMHSVVRMTVFSLAICGSLTEEASQRSEILQILDGERSVGNCSSLGRVLQTGIWQDSERMSMGSNPVRWREILAGEKLLLV